MNKIYKVIWSKAKHTYVVASEIAKGHTKGETTGRGLKKLAAAMLVAAALLSPSFAWAEDTATVTDTGNISAASASVTNSISVGHNANVGGAVNAGSLNSRGNLNVNGNALVKGTLTSQSTINGKEIVSQTNITAKNKVVGMQGVVDNTLTSGNYVTAGNTVGKNIVALDTQVKANADQFTTDKTSTALHISRSGDLIVGTKENQTVKDMEIRGKLTSGSISTGGITSTGDVTVTGKMAADGVTDETTKDGTYIKQNNTVGKNLGSLDTQVKANADAVSKLDTRITNVKEYVLSETNKNYVSKTDAAVQDGAIVKAANTIGDNVTKLDAALAQETAARLGADAQQDKVIQQVNENAAKGIATLATAYKNEVAAREAADTEIKQAMTDQKTSTALHVSKDGNLIVGTKENQVVKNMKINGQLTSGSIYTGGITSTGDVTVAGKMAADGVTDETTKDGTYIKQNNTVGNNLVSLDKQVKANADAINTEATAREKEDARLNSEIVNTNKSLNEAATNLSKLNTAVVDGFKTLKQADENEAVARKAADKALDSRAKALEDKTEAITYDKDSKTVMVEGKLTATEGITDGTIQDGKYVKADHYVGQNLNALDQGLQAEEKARVAADTALDDKITAETSARVAADTKLVEAVNSGVSLSNDNVLQKNTTTIDAQGNVTTSKTDANEMILNKGKDNQITLNEKGIKVGLNSGVMDKDGFYAGGDTYSEAKAALKSDGSIKGADGKFTVNSANGTVSVNDQIELNGATGVVKSNGLNVGDGNFTVNNNGGVKAADGKITLNSDGSVKAADGKFTVNSNGGVTAADGKITLNSDGSVKAANGNFTVNSNGGVTAADGKITLNSDGSVKAADGKFTVDTNGAVKTANGNTTIDSNGNVKTVGTLSAADGSFKVDSTGKITSTGLDAGNGTIQTTGRVQAGDVKTGTLETTGDATIGGDLTVNGKLNVDEIDLTKSGIVGDNNVTASTKVAAGEITGYKKATSTKDGSEKESSFDYDENSTSTWAKATDADGNWKKSTLTVEGSDVTSKVIDSDKNSNTSTQTASESNSTITGTADGKNYKSYITQNLKNILQGIKEGTNESIVDQTETGIKSTATDGKNTASTNLSNKGFNTFASDGKNKTYTKQTAESLTSQIGDDGKVKSVMNADGITNNADGGTITNSAKDLVNKATGNMTNTVGGKLLNDVTGDMENKVGGNLSTTVGGSQTTTVTGDSNLTAENINNTATNKITNKALDVETEAKSSIMNKVSNDYGSNTSTQLSYETKEEMSANGKTASYLRGATEEKSQLTDGAKKTTIDTVAGQTNTNITDGTNTSNDLQKADQIASSVTDGTNTTVVNQDAKSLASSITDGTKANNTSSTVDASVQRIQTDDTHYSVSSKSASKMEDALFNGSTVIDSLKDAEKGLVSTAVTDGTNLTGSSMTAKGITSSAAESIVNEIGDGSAVKSEMTANGITNTAKDGTITNDAKDLVNTASNSITDKVGENVERTMTTEKIQDKVGKTTVTTTDGLTKLTNEGGTHKTEMDFADVLKDLGVRGNATVDKKLTVKGDSDLQGNATVGKDLEVKGSTKLDGTLEVVGKSTFKDDVTMEKNLDVKGITTTDKLVVNNGATVAGGTTTDTLHVTSTATFDDIVTMKKDLSVGGNVDAASYTVKDTGIKIDKNGINAGGTKVTGLAPADISHAGSTDAVSGGQLYETNTRVSGLETRMGTVETRVDKLDNKIDKVGANAAAMANLHPLEFDEDSKWNVAAAVGSSGSETASAVGVFYRPNENVMVNASAAMGTGENMFGGGVSLRLGHGGNKAKEAQMKAAATENKELRAKVDDLTARMDALLSVLNPNMSKDFPDVPENHWAYEAVSRLAGNGIVEGYEDGKYHGERQMTRYEMAEIIYNALSQGAKAEKKLVEEFRPELQAMAAQKKA